VPQTNLRERIWVEQILLLQSQLPVIITTSCLTSIIVAVALSGFLDTTLLIVWILVVIAVTVVRLLHMIHWRRIVTTTDNVQNQIRQFAFFSGVSGTLWGVFGLLSASQDNPLIGVLTIMVLTGMVASATASLSHFTLAYLAFVLPALVPTGIILLFKDEPLYTWISILMVLYLVVSFIFSGDIKANMIQSIKLRFENVALVDSLQIEKNHAIESMQVATRANSAKSSFLAAASHDLRQPLCALRLYTATLQMLGNNDKQIEIARNIDTSVAALEELFDSLLDISKLDAGTLTVENEDFHLDLILDRILVDFNAIAQDKDIGLDVQVARHVVLTDPQLLERLLRNLVSNAVRYTESGAVTVTAIEENQTVRIEVRDTGCGISESDQIRIFEEFVQLNNPERDRSKGIGLGLSIVKRLSELMGISVSVKSEEDVGSVFSLVVPLGAEKNVVPITSPLIHTKRYLRDLFVLVVDDEVAIQDALKSILVKWGCTVVSAGSADELFEALTEHDASPDAAIVDLRLRSGENGIQVIEAIQGAFDAPVPSLILTGDIGADRLIEVQASGVPYMHKPCDIDALYEFLHKLVAQENKHLAS